MVVMAKVEELMVVVDCGGCGGMGHDIRWILVVLVDNSGRCRLEGRGGGGGGGGGGKDVRYACRCGWGRVTWRRWWCGLSAVTKSCCHC